MAPKTAQQLMTDNLIVKHYAGSHAYGTALPTSDTDFRGIFVADPINIRTPFYKIEEATDTSEEDTKLYELAQYMKLALDCNPNILETLWIDQSDIIFDTPAYQRLRQFRHELLSSKVAFTYSGYAISQINRIKGHNKWISNPQPVEPPVQTEFISMVHNFTDEKLFKLDLEKVRDDHRLIPYEKNVFGVYAAEGYQLYNNRHALNTVYDNADDFFTIIEGDRSRRRTPLYIVKFNKEVYDQAMVRWQQYWDWKKNRNEKRSVLEEQFGYDTKHAMHLVRLLRTGAEILTKEEVLVKRPDAAELLAIRDGKWTYEELVKYAEEMDEYIRKDLYTSTRLRKKPPISLAAKLIMEIQDIIWSPNVQNT